MNSGIEIVTHTHTLRIDLDVITHLPPVLTNWRRVRLWAELLGVEPGDEPARQLADPICDRVYLGLWRATADLNTSIYRSVFRTHIEVRSCFDGCVASRCIATESRYRQILLLLARIHSRIGEHGRAAAVVAACLVAGDIRRRLQLPADGRARQCWIAVSHPSFSRSFTDSIPTGQRLRRALLEHLEPGASAPAPLGQGILHRRGHFLVIVPKRVKRIFQLLLVHKEEH